MLGGDSVGVADGVTSGCPEESCGDGENELSAVELAVGTIGGAS